MFKLIILCTLVVSYVSADCTSGEYGCGGTCDGGICADDGGGCACWPTSPVYPRGRQTSPLTATPPPPARPPVSPDSIDVTGYAITGTHNASISGTFAKTAHVCNGLPVYQKGGSDGLVLYQQDGYKYWHVGSSARVDCGYDDPIYLTSEGFCAESPAGAGCANQWHEWPGGDGIPDGSCVHGPGPHCPINPAVKVVDLPAANPDLSVVAVAAPGVVAGSQANNLRGSSSDLAALEEELTSALSEVEAALRHPTVSPHPELATLEVAPFVDSETCARAHEACDPGGSGFKKIECCPGSTCYEQVPAGQGGGYICLSSTSEEQTAVHPRGRWQTYAASSSSPSPSPPRCCLDHPERCPDHVECKLMVYNIAVTSPGGMTYGPECVMHKVTGFLPAGKTVSDLAKAVFTNYRDPLDSVHISQSCKQLGYTEQEEGFVQSYNDLPAPFGAPEWYDGKMIDLSASGWVKALPSPSPSPSPSPAGGCPADSLTACMGVCPSNPAAAYSACVNECVSRCTKQGAIARFYSNFRH